MLHNGHPFLLCGEVTGQMRYSIRQFLNQIIIENTYNTSTILISTPKQKRVPLYYSIITLHLIKYHYVNCRTEIPIIF